MKLTTQPLFSVLVANYNNGKYLETCIQSIFSQTYTNWEILIVDDASTDESVAIYEQFRNYKQVKIFKNKENKGCGYTKGKCVQLSRGEICGFVDADDALSPNALAMMVKGHLDNPEASIVYSTHYICDESLQPQKVADYVGQIPVGRKSMTLLFPTISHFATFKREKYTLTEGISEIYPKAVDKDLYFKLEETGPVVFIEQPLYFYRHHPGSISLHQQKLIAHNYEMTAKFFALFRQGQADVLLTEMPHKKRQLIGGVVKVIYYEIKKGDYLIVGRLGYRLLISFPFALLKLMFKKIISPWEPHSI